MKELYVFGNYSPNLKGKPGSCYYLNGFKFPILLDFGIGNYKLVKEKIDLQNIDEIMIIISHNHTDHLFGIFKLLNNLIKYNKKVTVFMPGKGFMFKIFKVIYNKNVDIKPLNETTEFLIDNHKFSFCRTKHSVESYATRIDNGINSFIYTSDIFDVDDNLKRFCKDTDIVLIDSGIPEKSERISLKGYHGETKYILNSFLQEDLNVKKVYASHLKAKVDDEHYFSIFPKDKDITLIKMGNSYSIL